MNILHRKLLRDLWQAKGQFFSALIIVIIGVMFYSGLNSAYRNLEGASENYYREYRLGDIWVSFIRAPASVERMATALPFVKMATGRVSQDVNMGISGENAVVRLNTLPDVKKDIVNDIVIQSGRYFSAGEANQCLVEEQFFKAHGLQVGDFIYPIINGREVKLKVVGAVNNPEYVYAIKDSGELLADNRKFGVIYLKKSFGQAVLGFEGSINNLALTVHEGTDLAKAKDTINKLFKEFGVIGIQDRDSQLSSKMVSEEIKGMKSVAGAFPIIFFIVAAVIIYISMSRMVENQRAEIGVLKAFGFSDLQILFHYLSYAGLIALLGSSIGSLLGIFLAQGYTALINIYFNFPTRSAKMYPDLVLPSSLLVLGFCFLAGYNSCKSILKIMPGEAMRPKVPVQAKRIFLEKIPFLWARFSYSWKMTLRNIFRYKRRALLTSIGIVFATAVTLFAFGEKGSVAYLMEHQYNNIQNYDIKVSFARFLNMAEVKQLKDVPHVARLEPVVETGVELTNGWRKKEVGFTALTYKPEMYRVVDKTGNSVPVPVTGLLMPQKLARALGVKIGDTVYIKSYYPEKEKKEIKISGIITQYLGTNAYGSLDTVNYILGEGEIANGVVIRVDAESHENEVIEAFKEMPGVSSVGSKSDAMNNLKKNMEVMTSAIGAMIVLASVLAIGVIYNITTINIFERQRELATLKVLGFKDTEVRSLIFNENYVITLFGILIGLPFGKWLGTSLLQTFETDAYTIPFVLGPTGYLVVAFLIVSFTVLANFSLTRKIRSINMVEVLKSNE